MDWWFKFANGDQAFVEIISQKVGREMLYLTQNDGGTIYRYL